MEQERIFSVSEIVVFVLILVGVWITSFYSNYALFHSLAEVISIVIAFAIFAIAWNSRSFVESDYLLFIGIAYICIAFIDLIHTLTYSGINIFVGFTANLPTQLWIAARYLQALSLLIAPIFINRRLNAKLVLTIYAAVTGILLWLIFSGIFPTAWVEGSGLTQFKIISEYFISIILIGSVIFLWKYKEQFEKTIFYLIITSVILTIIAEIAFTFYVSVFGLSNLIGHFFKIIAFFLIYKAIVQIGLTKPYSLLARRGINNNTQKKEVK